MTELEKLEDRVRGLTPAELAAFREWFTKFDAELWDLQLESDAKAGRLNKLAEQALRDHAARISKKL